MKETIVISLGGSLVVPEKIDLDFLKRLQSLISRTKKKIIICVGGGRTAREYQKAMGEFGANDVEKDWIGIKISWLNAEIIKNIFSKRAYNKVITDPSKKLNINKDIIVAGGWKPGRSTDYDSVLLAKNSLAKTIINLTNIDYVCDKNPKEFPDARPFKKILWKDFRKIVGDKWLPGLSTPFDPEASKLAEKLKLKVIIINGSNLERLEDFLNNKDFIGTTIC